MFSNNPYRFLGVLSNSGVKLIHKNLSKIKAYSKIGKNLSLPYELDFFNLENLNRTESLIIEAENKILLDPNKIKHALFWFADSSSIDKIALDNLDKGNFEKSELIWRKVIKDKSVSKNNFSAYNNLSSLLFLKSLSKKNNDKIENTKDSVKSIKEALKLKSQLIFSDYFSNFYKLICDNENVIKIEDVLEFFNESISFLLEENFSKSEISKIINESNEKLSDSFNYSLINTPITDINNLINEANNSLNEDNSKGIEIGKVLIKKTLTELKLLKDILGLDDIKCQSIYDKLANQIIQCGILCFNKTGDDKDYMSSYKYAKSISIKDSTIDRANTAIKHCEDELKANICNFCNSNEISKGSLRVKMHKMNYDNTYSYFKNGGLEIFACTSCKSKVSSKENFAMFYAFIIYSALNGVTLLLWEGVPAVLAIDIFSALWGAPFFWILKWIYKQFRNPYFSLLSKHPVILKLKLEGYIFGMP